MRASTANGIRLNLIQQNSLCSPHAMSERAGEKCQELEGVERITLQVWQETVIFRRKQQRIEVLRCKYFIPVIFVSAFY